MDNIPESDWKYLRKVKDELLEFSCERINDEASRIITDPTYSQRERFLRLFGHVLESNKIIANCFDDWRRSNIVLKLLSLCEEGLLTDEHILRLSEETQSRISQS